MDGHCVLAYLRSLCRALDEARPLRAFGLGAMALPVAIGLASCDADRPIAPAEGRAELSTPSEGDAPRGPDAAAQALEADGGPGPAPALAAPDAAFEATPRGAGSDAPDGAAPGPPPTGRRARPGLGSVLGGLDAGAGLNPLYVAPCTTCLYGVTDPGPAPLGPGGEVGTGSRPPGRVAVRVLEVRGRADRAIAERVLRARAARLRACYERGLATDPRLAGQVVLRLVVSADGSVADVDLVGPGLASAEVNECVVALARRLRFPATETGEALEVTVACRMEPAG